jgi:hypothetical protein
MLLRYYDYVKENAFWERRATKVSVETFLIPTHLQCLVLNACSRRERGRDRS